MNSLEIKFFKMASRIGVMLGVPDGKIAFEDAMDITWSTNKFGGDPVSLVIKLKHYLLSAEFLLIL